MPSHFLCLMRLQILHSLLTLFLFSLSFSTALSKSSTPLVQPYDLKEIAPPWIERVFSISTESPAAKAMSRNKTTQRLMAPVYFYHDVFSRLVEKRKAEKNRNACGLRHIDWVTNIIRMSKILQYGELDDSCPSFIQVSAAIQSGEMDASLLRDARTLIFRGTYALYLAVRDIAEIPDRTDPSLNWTSGIYPGRSWDLTRNSQRCRVANAFFIQKNGVSYFRTYLNNLPEPIWSGTYGRQSIIELVRQDMNSSFRSVHRRVGTEDHFENSSTLLLRRDGRSHNDDNPGTVPFDDPSSPLGRVFRLNQNAIDLASDAVTISNIAILALPMVMSLIPLAMLADMQGWAMLCYVIFTDVFSTLPLLIKGIELIMAGRSTADVVMFHLGNTSFSQMEIFAVECSGESKFMLLGIVFVIVSLAVLILGVCLEVFAAWYMRNRRRELVVESAGRMFDVVSYGFLGAMDESEKVRQQLSYDMSMEVAEEELVLAQQGKENDKGHSRLPWRLGSRWK